MEVICWGWWLFGEFTYVWQLPVPASASCHTLAPSCHSGFSSNSSFSEEHSLTMPSQHDLYPLVNLYNIIYISCVFSEHLQIVLSALFLSPSWRAIKITHIFSCKNLSTIIAVWPHCIVFDCVRMLMVRHWSCLKDFQFGSTSNLPVCQIRC